MASEPISTTSASTDAERTNGPSQHPADEEPFAPGTFTERGEEAETTAFHGDGSYSGGEFAGGARPDRKVL